MVVSGGHPRSVFPARHWLGPLSGQCDALPCRATVSNRMKRDLAIRALDMALDHCSRTNGGQGLAPTATTEGLHLLPGRRLQSNLPRGHHTDRPSHGFQENRCRATGSQYCSHDYQKRVSKHGFKVSPLASVNIRCPLPGRRVYTPRRGQRMSGKGNCYDNSMVLRRENAPLGPFLILLTFFKSIKAELIWRNRWETRRQAEGAIFQYINGFYNPRRRHSSLGGKSPLAFERKAA